MLLVVALGRDIVKDQLWLLDEGALQFDSLGCLEVKDLFFLLSLLLGDLPLARLTRLNFRRFLRVKLLDKRLTASVRSRLRASLELEAVFIIFRISFESNAFRKVRLISAVIISLCI